MKLPDTVRIGAAEYTIRRRKMDDLYGHTEHIKARIELDTRQADTHIRDTMLHEVLHVVFHQAGLAATVDNWTHDFEELMVTVLTPWLLSAIRDNPQLVAFLTAD
jgi:predicted SprT family Zn-dependent metalloprotease